MAAPTYDYFGSNPVTIIMKTSNAFDGVAFADNVVPDIKSGVVTFPQQAGGGLLNFHKRPLLIKNILASFAGTAKIVYEDGTEIQLKTLAAATPSNEMSFYLPVKASLKIEGGSGATQVSITAVEAGPDQSL